MQTATAINKPRLFMVSQAKKPVQENLPEQKTPTPTPPKPKTALDSFTEVFGQQQGCVLFCSGRSLNDCLKEKIVQQRKAIESLKAEKARFVKSSADMRRFLQMRAETPVNASSLESFAAAIAFRRRNKS